MNGCPPRPNMFLCVKKPLLFNLTRKGLQGPVLAGGGRGGCQHCGPDPQGNVKVSWKSNNTPQNCVKNNSPLLTTPTLLRGYNSPAPVFFVYLCVWLHQHWPCFVNGSAVEHPKHLQALSKYTHSHVCLCVREFKRDECNALGVSLLFTVVDSACIMKSLCWSFFTHRWHRRYVLTLFATF